MWSWYTFIKSDTGLISWYTKYILFMIIIIRIILHYCVMKQSEFPYILAFEKKSKHSFASMCEWSNIDGFNFASLVKRMKQWKIRMNEHNHIRGLLRTIKIKWNNKTHQISLFYYKNKCLITSGHVVISSFTSLSPITRDETQTYYNKGWEITWTVIFVLIYSKLTSKGGI